MVKPSSKRARGTRTPEAYPLVRGLAKAHRGDGIDIIGEGGHVAGQVPADLDGGGQIALQPPEFPGADGPQLGRFAVGVEIGVNGHRTIGIFGKIGTLGKDVHACRIQYQGPQLGFIAYGKGKILLLGNRGIAIDLVGVAFTIVEGSGQKLKIDVRVGPGAEDIPQHKIGVVGEVHRGTQKGGPQGGELHVVEGRGKGPDDIEVGLAVKAHQALVFVENAVVDQVGMETHLPIGMHPEVARVVQGGLGLYKPTNQEYYVKCFVQILFDQLPISAIALQPNHPSVEGSKNWIPVIIDIGDIQGRCRPTQVFDDQDLSGIGHSPR